MARLELEVGTDVLLLETGDALLLEALSVNTGAYPYEYPFLYYLPDGRTFVTSLLQERKFITKVIPHRTFITEPKTHRKFITEIGQY